MARILVERSILDCEEDKRGQISRVDRKNNRRCGRHGRRIVKPLRSPRINVMYIVRERVKDEL